MMMVLLMEGKKKDSKTIQEGLQKGYRVEHPERIAGYAGFFFNLGDVYVSDAVYEYMHNCQEFHDFVLESLKRFEKGEFGDISQSDLDENIENRWLFGIARLFGRYGFRLRPVTENESRYFSVIKVHHRDLKTYVSFESEFEMG